MADGVEKEQVVTPWEAHAAEGKAAIDYDKLISKRVAYKLFFYNLPVPRREIRQPGHRCAAATKDRVRNETKTSPFPKKRHLLLASVG